MRMPTAPNPYAEQVETEIMCLAVIETISSILTATRLSEHEVLEILEKVSVDTVGEIENVIAPLNDFDPVKRIGATKLGAIIKEAIVEMADLAEIQPDELACILTRKNDGAVENIVGWLRAGNRIGQTAGPGPVAAK